MKTVIRLRDDQGRIISAREELQPEPIEVLRNFSLTLLLIGLVFLWI
ncbi:hypothetical protein MHH60_31925 [Paenibacillus sp. FSL H7-0716]|nr:hypothetical protein [Paenibacillus odorifer]